MIGDPIVRRSIYSVLILFGSSFLTLGGWQFAAEKIRLSLLHPASWCSPRMPLSRLDSPQLFPCLPLGLRHLITNGKKRCKYQRGNREQLHDPGYDKCGQRREI